jgi:hypothetical protein
MQSWRGLPTTRQLEIEGHSSLLHPENTPIFDTDGTFEEEYKMNLLRPRKTLFYHLSAHIFQANCSYYNSLKHFTHSIKYIKMVAFTGVRLHNTLQTL